MQAAVRFLKSRDTSELLARVGTTIEAVPPPEPVNKRALQDSYGGNQTEPCDDLLAGQGMFYITEQRRLCLDCTAGHYQMTWGYNDPALCRAAAEAVEAGIVWDGHCNIPQTPVKLLAHRLVEAVGGSGPGGNGLETVHLGCCTGSVACAAALKIQLICFERRKQGAAPVIIVLDGNYHGTDMVAQFLRGMWPRYVTNLEAAAVQPNDTDALRAVFKRYGDRVAAFWAEPIMMNCEVTVLDASYLQAARALCDEVGALMCLDEIQTGFWQREVFAFHSLGIVPDLVVAGKGMTAGFHPQAALIYRGRLDVLAQYDAISTNGSAPLPCYIALCCLDRLASEADRIVKLGDRYEAAMQALAGEFPSVLRDARGRRHMMGLKFHRVEDALDFHRRAVAAGLWLRVHAYHEGHSTVLTKLPLVADEQIVDFVVAKLRQLLKENGR
jgi:acetylornithine/succinyldiaminopimelate/putrescine aminotransferase